MAKDSSAISDQLQKQRRKVDFDTFDILVQQLLTMVESKAIDVAPAYQRQFRWDDTRCSELVESLFLGIPVPSLFMAANRDGTWELVDGVQRLCTLVSFAGSKSAREIIGKRPPLRLTELTKLTSLNGFTFKELPETIQLQFSLRPVKVVTLSDKSDRKVRFDLFERLNTGGVELTEQEIRDCVYRGKFSKFLERLAKSDDFKQCVRLTKKQNEDGTREECVLRFFAFLNSYEGFVHSVTEFLNDYMEEASKDFDYDKGEAEFTDAFRILAKRLPDGISRPGPRTLTPLNLFEAVAVGLALARRRSRPINTLGIKKWIGHDTLKKHTTGATNNPAAVTGRIEFCRDRFLGKPEK